MKTLAIRLDDDLHAQLSVLAQLSDTTITELIRTAIEKLVEAEANNPALTGKAQEVLDEIEREAQTRRAAIASMFGNERAGAARSAKRGTTSKSEQ